MALFGSPKSPVDDDLREWIDDSAAWIVEEFGLEATRQRRVVLPEAEFFPDVYDGTEGTLEPLIRRMCQYMDVDRRRFQLKIFADDDTWAQRSLPAYETSHSGAAGLFVDPADGSRLILALEEAKLADAASVVATTAHEMCHIHLLADGRVNADDEDHEFLTDLLTVFFGLGVFTANAAIQYEKWDDGMMQGWSSSRSGYLPEDAYGYSLALFALVRNEGKPLWAKYLQPNIATYFKKSARFLRKVPPRFIPKA